MQLPQGGTVHWSAVIMALSLRGAHSLLDLMSCMPRSLDNQTHKIWHAILESQGTAVEVEGWCNQRCFLRVSASLRQDGAGCRGNAAGSQDQPVPSASATSVCPFPPSAEDSDYTAIPVAVLARLWLHDLEPWANERLKECIKKHLKAVILLLLSCTFCWFTASSNFQTFDIALTCVSNAMGLYGCNFFFAQYAFFWGSHRCCVPCWHYWHCTVLSLT